MTSDLLAPLNLSNDQFRVLAAHVGMRELPNGLLSASPHATVNARDAARDQATRDLVKRRLIVDSRLHRDIIPMLETIRRPDRELAIRLVTPDGSARISALRRASITIIASRREEGIQLHPSSNWAELSDVTAELISRLPPSAPADIDAFSAHMSDMEEQLTGTHDSLELTDRMRSLGAEPRNAVALGTALSSRLAFAETVYNARTTEEDRVVKYPAAVAAFYTKRGRIVTAPSASPTGKLWVTLKPGSDRAVGQAISQLVDLSGVRWEVR